MPTVFVMTPAMALAGCSTFLPV